MNKDFYDMEQERNDFDDLSDFLTEWEKEEIENEKNDALILALARMFDEYDKRDSVINPERVRRVLSTYRAMKKEFVGQNVKVTCELMKPTKDYGYISIEGKKIVFIHPEILADAIRGSTGVDGCMKTNGNVVINFGYAGIVKTIRGR